MPNPGYLLAFIVGSFLISGPAVNGATMTVCASGCDSSTITGGVVMAAPGDVIRIMGRDPPYNEKNIQITKPLVLEGTEGAVIEVNKTSGHDSALVVATGGEVTIRGLTLSGADRGISLGPGSAGVILTIDGVTITTDAPSSVCVDSTSGVYQGTRVLFTDSQCDAKKPFQLVGTSPGTGVHILDSRIRGEDEIRLHLEEVEISGNSFKGPTYIWINNAEKAVFEDNRGTEGFNGLYIESARKASVRNNIIITDNLDEFEANGQWVEDGDKYLLMENNLIQCIGEENGGVYIENYGSPGSIVLMRNNTIENCNYFYVKGSVNTMIKGNQIMDTGLNSIEFMDVGHSLITRNLVSKGTSEEGYSPISITGGRYNLVADNTYVSPRGVYYIGEITGTKEQKRTSRVLSEGMDVIERGYETLYNMVLVIALILEAILFPVLTMSIKGTPEFLPLNLTRKKE